MSEIWKPVPNYESLYAVSDQGQIWSLRRKKLMALHPLGNVDYLGVALYSADGRRSTRTVHSLVLEAFHGPRPEGLVACHGIGGPTDNRSSNLRWDTGHENALDRVRHGTHNHAKKTRCKRGHLLRGSNLKQHVWLKDRRRECRACGAAHCHIRKYGGDLAKRADFLYLKYTLEGLGIRLPRGTVIL